MSDAQIETTLAILKPDATAQKATGRIIDKILTNDLEIAAIKTLLLTDRQAREFYAVHMGKDFYEPLIKFMRKGPIIVMALRGPGAIAKWRELMGPTNPEQATEGTIRKMFGTDTRHNASHGSDAPETAAKEIAFFFDPEEILA